MVSTTLTAVDLLLVAAATVVANGVLLAVAAVVAGRRLKKYIAPTEPDEGADFGVATNIPDSIGGESPSVDASAGGMTLEDALHGAEEQADSEKQEDSTNE